MTDTVKAAGPAEGAHQAEALLAALTARFGPGFELSAERLGAGRPPAGGSADTCVLCDSPQDACTSCDASDFTCNKQHDIVCFTCDEGDTSCPRDGACNLMGDVPCGLNDK